MAAGNSGDEILEGFLCPICMKDLISPAQLSTHFEESHSEDKDILKQLRAVFGKAKNAILKKEESPVTVSKDDAQTQVISNGTPGSGGIDVDLWQAQSFGQTRSHYLDFRQDRREKIEIYVVETNNILIRLEKLMKAGIYKSDSTLPAAMKARKDLEKRLVPWESDSDARFCRTCMKRFSVLMRRHHCRLCGKVCCGVCCDFISRWEANDIVSSQGEILYFGNDQKDGDNDNKSGIRTCYPCLELLQKHCQRKLHSHVKPAIVGLYERMKMLMAECDLIHPKFIQMVESLNSGLTEYSLDVANETKVKLFKMFEAIDAISKKIQVLGTANEKQPHPHTLRLQRLVRSYAANFLQENMFSAPSLPNRDQYDKLVRLRDERMERQKQEEKQRKIAASLLEMEVSTSRRSAPLKEAMAAGGQRKYDSQTTKLAAMKSDEDSTSEDDSNRFGAIFTRGSLRARFNKKVQRPFTAVSISKTDRKGWGPVNVTMSGSPDPMTQQMDIIKGYIRQAKHERRFEEVALFEQNLKELELEYIRQRQGK